jgi:hypothetical protein
MGPCYVNVLQLLMVIPGYTIYEHVITQQLISDMESPICMRNLSSRNRLLVSTLQSSCPLKSGKLLLTHDSS